MPEATPVSMRPSCARSRRLGSELGVVVSVVVVMTHRVLSRAPGNHWEWSLGDDGDHVRALHAVGSSGDRLRAGGGARPPSQRDRLRAPPDRAAGGRAWPPRDGAPWGLS